MPVALLFGVIIVVVVALLIFNKTLLDNRRAELEITSRAEEEAKRSLTESQLVDLIRSAVREETGEVVSRLERLESRMNALPHASPDAGSDEWNDDSDASKVRPKTLGRTSPEHPS